MWKQWQANDSGITIEEIRDADKCWPPGGQGAQLILVFQPDPSVEPNPTSVKVTQQPDFLWSKK